MEQTKKITKMKQETKATIAYLAAIIFVIICIALMAVTPAYGQNQTVIKDSKGEVVYVKIKTASGYIVKDKNGILLYTVVENDTEKRVYDASGRLISVEKKSEKMKTMKDQVTSIEQSKRLVELGVPADKASMVWATCSGKYHLSVLPHYKATPEYIKSGESIPAFTVADLLGLIRSVIFTTNELNPTLEKIGEDEWAFEFSQISEDEDYGFSRNKSLVELLVGRIEWIVSNGYKLNI